MHWMYNCTFIAQYPFFLLLVYGAYGLALFGPSSGPVYWTSINCTGTEADIFSCRHTEAEIQNTCSHTTDAGVKCSEKTTCEINNWLTCCTSQHGPCNFPYSNGSDCYCDQYCYKAGDCCRNIGFTCPPPSELRASVLY